MDRAKLQAIEKRLAAIAKLHGGRLTPDDVVEDARSPSSPLHDQFDWNDAEAAAKWRISQARELIRSVKVVINVETKEISTVRYVRDPTAGQEQGYVEVAKIRTDADLAREALAAEVRAANALVQRAKSLADALGLSVELQMIEESVQVLGSKLKAVA